jgi:hypothetical protein
MSAGPVLDTLFDKLFCDDFVHLAADSPKIPGLQRGKAAPIPCSRPFLSVT